MGTFAKALREGKIVSPTAHKYDSKKMAKIASEHILDDEDGFLINAIALVRRKQALIKKIVDKNICGHVKKKDLIEGIIGVVNRSACILSDTIREKLESKSCIRAQDLISGGTVSLLGGINNATVDEISQALVDSYKYPLMNAMMASDGVRKTNKDMFFAVLGGHQALAGMHEAVNDIWSSALYGMDKVIVDKVKYLCVPSSVQYAKKHYIGILRRRQRSFECLMHAQEYSKKISGLAIPIMTIIGHGKDKKIVTRPSSFDENIEHATMLLTLDEYFDEALDFELPQYGGVTLRQLFVALMMVKGLVASMRSRYGTDVGATHMKTITSYAHRFSGPDILASLMKIAGVTDAKARAILDQFSFRFDGWDVDMMTKPFVKYDGKYYPVIPASNPEPSFLATYWLDKGGYPIAERGGQFERIVRKDFENIASEFNLVSCNNALKFTSGDTTEQIDLVFVFGCTLYVCEIKCIFCANTPYQWYMTKCTLESAVAQCERKARFVKNNLCAFKDKYFSGSDIQEVRSLVVTNEGTLTGEKFSGTYITDHRSLAHYFDLTGAKIVHHENYDFRDELLRFVGYYRDPSEAASRFEDYLMEPPQYSYHNSMVHLVQAVYPVMDKDDLPVYRYYFQVRDSST